MNHLTSLRVACAGGLGILVCSLLMSLTAVGVGVVALSKNANSGSSGNMGSMITATGNGSQSTPLQFLVMFFSGLWGQVILIVSFGLMLIGMWFTGKKKIIPIAFSGVVSLYISMYVYYSVSLEIIGAIVLGFAYLTIYNSRVSKVVKLV